MKTAWAYAKSADEINQWIKSRVEEAEILSLKEKGEYVDKVREGIS